MAELATIARPYAEALLKAGGDAAAALQLHRLAGLAGNSEMVQFAANPQAHSAHVLQILQSIYQEQFQQVLVAPVLNLLMVVLENGRLSAIAEIAEQFQALVNQQNGIADAVIHSAFALNDAQTHDIVMSLEQRFKQKLNATVIIDTSLIGGIRVVVGDEVLDTSVKARLEQMKVALTA